MARTRVRFGRLGALLALAVGLPLAGGRLLAGPAEASSPPMRYVVEAGDTLWGIAAARLPHGEDPRPLIHAIREANGLPTSALPAGAVLVIPAA